MYIYTIFIYLICSENITLKKITHSKVLLQKFLNESNVQLKRNSNLYVKLYHYTRRPIILSCSSTSDVDNVIYLYNNVFRLSTALNLIFITLV